MQIHTKTDLDLSETKSITTVSIQVEEIVEEHRRRAFVCICVLVLARIKFVFSGFQQFGRCMNMFEASSPSQTTLPWLLPSSFLVVAVVDNELLESV